MKHKIKTNMIHPSNAAVPSGQDATEAWADDDGTGFAGAYAASQDWQPPKDAKAREKLQEFQDYKFGFLICWGTQTQFETVDGSWSLCPERWPWTKRPEPHTHADDLTYRKAYEALQLTFNPVRFDPEAWANLTEAAGVRYMIFVTKHHDGFSFWDTKTTNYKITSPNTPFHTNPNANVTRRLFDTFRQRNIPVGVYFSKPDWHVPSFWNPKFPRPLDRNANYSPKEHPEEWKKFKDFTWAQINELTSEYGPVDILWLDGGWVQPGANDQDIDMPGIAAMVRKNQPDGILIVDRTVGNGCEDYLTPENYDVMPAAYTPNAWEICMPLQSWWAWTRDTKYRSANFVIRNLVKAVARNGNLLLGVGPDAQGEFAHEAVSILNDIGAWLKVNGDAIYGTRPVAPYELGDVFFTRKPDGTVYAIVLGPEPASVFSPPTADVRASITLPASLLPASGTVSLVGGMGEALPMAPGAEKGTREVSLPHGQKMPFAVKISNGSPPQAD